MQPLSSLLAFVLCGTVLGASAPAHSLDGPIGGADGKSVAVRFNERPLPAVENVPSTKGYHHYVKLEEAIVDMRPNGRFVATFRYYHELIKDGAPVPKLKVLRETHRGTWTISGGVVTFAPELGKKSKLPRPVTGLVTADRMKVNYVVDDGAGPRTLRVELKRQANWYLEGK